MRCIKRTNEVAVAVVKIGGYPFGYIEEESYRRLYWQIKGLSR